MEGMASGERKSIPSSKIQNSNKQTQNLSAVYFLHCIHFYVFMQIISIKDTLTDPCGGQIKI